MTTTSLPSPRSLLGTRLRRSLLAGAGAVALLASSLTLLPSASAAPTQLVGTFRLTSGSCSGGKISGTYLRMILPSGGANGPYLANSDSPCSDQTFTPLKPGSDGGLVAGAYQPTPTPVFDAKGNARAGRVTAPAAYYGTGFATSTNPTDTQTGTKVPAPKVTLDGTRLTADLRAFAVTWNKQYFNQGSPKPNGSSPGNTRAATGTYDPQTRAFTLTWSSQVQGGPFDKFAGQWHLAGTFVPAAGSATGSPTQGSSGAAPSTGTSGGSSGSSTGGGTTTSGGAASAGGAAAPGAPGAPGATTAPGAPAVDPATGEAVVAAPGAAQLSPGTSVVTKQGWRASPWLLGLTIGIAVVGFGSLIALQLLGRRRQSLPATPEVAA